MQGWLTSDVIAFQWQANAIKCQGHQMLLQDNSKINAIFVPCQSCLLLRLFIFLLQEMLLIFIKLRLPYFSKKEERELQSMFCLLLFRWKNMKLLMSLCQSGSELAIIYNLASLVQLPVKCFSMEKLSEKFNSKNVSH